MNASLGELRIVSWTLGDSGVPLAAILAQSRSKSPGEDWLRAKFTQAPLPVGASLVMAGDRVVGIVAFCLNNYAVAGVNRLVAISYDTSVDREFRGRGRFSGLLDHAEQLAKTAGAELFLNLPNNNSKRDFAKAGWEPLSPSYPYVSPTRKMVSEMRGGASALRQLRSHAFNPVKLDEDILNVAARADASGRAVPLSCSGTPDDLQARFSRGRGAGYATVHAGSTVMPTSSIPYYKGGKLLSDRYRLVGLDVHTW